MSEACLIAQSDTKQYCWLMTSATRTRIDAFCSFAAADESDARGMWDRLQTSLASSQDYDWHLWKFTDELLPGDDFHEQIQAALTTADLGIFAMSTDFLNSDYIRTHELPPFLKPAPGKQIVPIMLKPLPRRVDLRGLESRQIFAYHKPFTTVDRPHQKDVWCNDLHDQLHRIADRHIVPAKPAPRP